MSREPLSLLGGEGEFLVPKPYLAEGFKSVGEAMFIWSQIYITGNRRTSTLDEVSWSWNVSEEEEKT